MTGGPEKETDRPSSFIQLARLSSVGLEMAIAVLLGWAVGSWIDRKLGTEPWMMILCLLFGVAAGFKGLYVAARNATKKEPKG